MVLALEMRAPRLVGVPARLDLAERPDDAVGGVDRVRARPHLAHVDGDAPHLDLEPEDADIGADQLLVLRLGNEDGVGTVAAQMGHQGPVARRFLLDDRLHRDGRGGLEPDAAKRAEAEEVRGRPRLHGRPAAPEEPIAADDRIEGRRAPHVRGARGHDVDMRLQDQRAARLLAGAMDADDDRRLGMLRRPGAGARMAGERLAVHREALHGEAAGAELAEEVILDRVLLAADRGEADQVLREGDLRGETLRDGSGDAVGKGGVERHRMSGRAAMTGRSSPCSARA